MRGLGFFELFDDNQTNCGLCPLFSNKGYNFIIDNNNKSKIMIVDDFFRKDNDNLFFLEKVLGEVGIDFNKDCQINYFIKCSSNKNKINENIEFCRDSLLKEIKIVNPKIIILLGKFVFDNLIGYKLTKKGLSSAGFGNWTNEVIKDIDLKYFIFPVFHPFYIKENEKNMAIYNYWKKNFQLIRNYLDKDFEELKIPEFSISNTKDEIIKNLNILKEKSCFAFDIETSGLRPDYNDILSISFCNEDFVFGFDWKFIQEQEIFNLLKSIFLDEKIGKIAHNCKFEHQWIYNKMNIDINNWVWDTQIAEHCLENQKSTGLKHLVYTKLGLYGWDDEIDNYIDAKNCKSRNNLKNFDFYKLIEYNCFDSFFTFQLYLEQEKLFESFSLKGLRFFLNGNICLAKIQENGIVIDLSKMESIKVNISEKLKIIEEKIYNSEEVKKWDKDEVFNFNSSKQLAHLLFDILKVKNISYTDKGSIAMDVDALSKIKIPLTNLILRYRKWYKILNTYISQFEQEQVGGYIKPFFNLCNVSSYRSSSQNPNFQNIPKRDKEVKNLIRGFLIPRQGNFLVEYDYKSMEVMIMACYSKDENLINYLFDKNSDMHKDIAKQIFLKEEITKEERFLAKNGFVFPVFYGSYFEQTAPEIWEKMPVDSKDYLKQKGIKKFVDFKEHIKQVENDFWFNRFKGILEWKKEQWNFYLKNGYIELKTGFRCSGVMGRKEVVNYPIQGSAFHCLLWTLIQVNKLMERKRMKSKIIGQIHDAIVIDVVPEEEKEVDYLIWNYGTQKIREFWEWLIIPLQIEKEKSEINGCWAEMKESKLLI